MKSLSVLAIELAKMVTTTLTIQDIWPYGSNKSNPKKFDIDAILPYILLPLLLVIASISSPITISVMVFISMAALYVHSRPRSKNRYGTTVNINYKVLTFIKHTTANNIQYS